MTVDEFSAPETDEKPLELEEPVAFRQGVDGPEPVKLDPDGDDPPGPAPKRLPMVLAAIVLLLVAVEVGATLIQHGSVPRETHWRTAATKVRALRDKADPVLFAPSWVEPLGRLHLGDQIDTELLLLSDVDSHKRVFQVGVRGRRHPWLSGERPKQEWDFGGVQVALFEREKPARVLHDFTRRIPEAQVTRIGQKVHRCGWNGGLRRFVCDPARSWNWVGPHLAEVGHRPRRCIFAHAVDGEVMRITYPGVQVGSSLVVYTGIDDFENRKRSNAAVLLKVLAGPKQIHAVQHQNDWSWHRSTVDTRDLAGQTHPISFEISTPHAFARTFCFSAETRE